jgi:hypothetical protein
VNSTPSSNVPENYEAQGYSIERVATHTTLASVSRLMGYTPEGIRELCKEIHSEWILIGLTRTKSERVHAKRVNGKLTFSVGSDQAYALTSDSAQRKEIRRQLADEIVRRVAPQRPRVSNVSESSNLMDSEVNAKEINTVPEQAVHKIISHYGPRDHTGE